jgi:hypothetical protein
MCDSATIPPPELYDDLAAILEALTPGDQAGRAPVETRAAWSASMLRAILGTSAGAPRNAAELRARLAHPAIGHPAPARELAVA